jgi:histidinol-phosphate phosphatase family protein
MTGRAAVFLDRDGTLIEDRHYLRDPAQVQLLQGATEAVRQLNLAGLAAVVVTNQSGIARGRLTEADYAATTARLEELLAADGARLDGHWHCPHLPELTGPCDCRKPGPLLYRQAAAALGLDLSRSWWVGDRLRDVQPAQRFGGRGILVRSGQGVVDAALPAANAWPSAADLLAAVRLILDEPL